MEIREAILKAADWIQRYPSDFKYMENEIPDCGMPGCAIGWIGHFLGVKRRNGFDIDNVMKIMGLKYLHEFSRHRMDVLCGWESNWRNNADACAAGMRLYADKYHPAPVSTPNWEAISTADAKEIA